MNTSIRRMASLVDSHLIKGNSFIAVYNAMFALYSTKASWHQDNAINSGIVFG